ncbi:unnamed protein product [Amoebophrya sp. A120]|nr:unnamed protein product [Amoebophrya sp. A120]|eukprot:GSA120T00014261001.1
MVEPNALRKTTTTSCRELLFPTCAGTAPSPSFAAALASTASVDDSHLPFNRTSVSVDHEIIANGQNGQSNAGSSSSRVSITTSTTGGSASSSGSSSGLLENNYNTKQIEIQLDGESLTLHELMLLGLPNTKIKVCTSAFARLLQSRAVIDTQLDSKKVVYGINTGFGRLSNVGIEEAKLQELQVNLIRSHATGVGKPLNHQTAKRVMALRINTLLKGCSGISEKTFKQLVEFFNSGLIPYIREQGTVGASGDLVPLAHIALNVICEGQCFVPTSSCSRVGGGSGMSSSTKQVYELKPCDRGLFEKFGLTPATLKAKDGLALINGTQFICGVGAEAVANAIHLIRISHIAAAMTLVALGGHPEAYDAQVAHVRPHPGQIASAEIMRALVPVGSIQSRKFDCQDPYSLRCLPQVHGCVLEAVVRCKDEFEIEINSATDNPLIFGDTKRMLSGGNFHAEYPAKSLDCLSIYVHELASISYSRLMRLLNPHKNYDMLPTFLSTSAGLSSGFMTWENVSAALVSENKVLCHPSSVDSLSTCGDKEDHVSMGGMSARKAVTVTKNVARCLAIEIMAATQALYILKKKEGDSHSTVVTSSSIPGKINQQHQFLPKNVQKVFDYVTKLFPEMKNDRYLVPECDLIYNSILSGDLFAVLLDDAEAFHLEPMSQFMEHSHDKLQPGTTAGSTSTVQPGAAFALKSKL